MEYEDVLRMIRKSSQAKARAISKEDETEELFYHGRISAFEDILVDLRKENRREQFERH
jgi:hypothetical protein